VDLTGGHSCSGRRGPWEAGPWRPPGLGGPRKAKYDFGSGSAPDHTGGAYSAPPDPVAGFQGPTSKGGDGRDKGRGWEGEGREEGREEKGGRGGLSGNVAEEAFCLKSAPDRHHDTKINNKNTVIYYEVFAMFVINK